MMAAQAMRIGRTMRMREAAQAIRIADSDGRRTVLIRAVINWNAVATTDPAIGRDWPLHRPWPRHGFEFRLRRGRDCAHCASARGVECWLAFAVCCSASKKAM